MRYLIFIVFLVLSLVSCSSGDKVIKDKDLENILHDMFLQNAYSKTTEIDLDSLNMYKSIFEKYGYREQDMLRTLTIFTRRKSSRFSTMLDRTATRLNREYDDIRAEVAMRDTINNIAQRRFGKLVFEDYNISITDRFDTTALSLFLPAKEGTYQVSYQYKFNADSVKKNFSVKGEFYAVDSVSKKELNTKSMWLSTSNIKRSSFDVQVPASADSLHGTYMWFPKQTTFAPVVIDSVRVMYFMPEQQALDSLLREFLNYQFKVDTLTLDSLKYGFTAQDSLSLGLDTTGLIIQRDSIY